MSSRVRVERTVAWWILRASEDEQEPVGFGYAHSKLLFPSYNSDPPCRAPEGGTTASPALESKSQLHRGKGFSFGGEHVREKRKGEVWVWAGVKRRGTGKTVRPLPAQLQPHGQIWASFQGAQSLAHNSHEDRQTCTLTLA